MKIPFLRCCAATLAGLLLLLTTICPSLPAPERLPGESAAGEATAEPSVYTFSICAYDPEEKQWGIGVASKIVAVGAYVPWVQAKSGAIATQAGANLDHGPRGLRMLADGKAAQEVLDALLANDSRTEVRQLGVVDSKGATVNYTGKKCEPWAGAKAGKNYTCQGNALAGPEVIDEMAKAFANGKGPLAWRLVAALEAGQKAGGEKGGKQSAAVLVVQDRGKPRGSYDRAVDLRVDDHMDPIPELARILALKIERPKR